VQSKGRKVNKGFGFNEASRCDMAFPARRTLCPDGFLHIGCRKGMPGFREWLG
jgi:hypothetical protein